VDAYQILHKNPDGSYSAIRQADGRKQAKERMRLFKSQQPGSYLLLNLNTKMIEDENDDAGTTARVNLFCCSSCRYSELRRAARLCADRLA
jgi:hypothetical protein